MRPPAARPSLAARVPPFAFACAGLGSRHLSASRAPPRRDCARPRAQDASSTCRRCACRAARPSARGGSTLEPRPLRPLHGGPTDGRPPRSRCLRRAPSTRSPSRRPTCSAWAAGNRAARGRAAAAAAAAASPRAACCIAFFAIAFGSGFKRTDAHAGRLARARACFGFSCVCDTSFCVTKPDQSLTAQHMRSALPPARRPETALRTRSVTTAGAATRPWSLWRDERATRPRDIPVARVHARSMLVTRSDRASHQVCLSLAVPVTRRSTVQRGAWPAVVLATRRADRCPAAGNLEESSCKVEGAL